MKDKLNPLRSTEPLIDRVTFIASDKLARRRKRFGSDRRWWCGSESL